MNEGEVKKMKVAYIVNNYQLGRKVKTTPTDKIVSAKRIDKTHTEIIYMFESTRQKEFCDKVLAKNGKIVD
jgi:L-asparaginase/Glu-tRNA(Gln) amidotransferase subunit D